MNHQVWAVILAGGDGTRLRGLTRRIAGEERPKQFCAIYGGKTLLAQSRARLARTISPERTLFVVVKGHERFYGNELADTCPSRIVVQPCNKGTTAAIAYSVLRIAQADEDATVGFFPTDHFYADEPAFIAGVESAFKAIQDHPELVILMGAQPQHAEVQYGWIEPGGSMKCRSDSPLFRVSRFWEKPSPGMARCLLDRGCLWNTFVMIGRASSFLAILKSAVPGVLAVLEPAGRQSDFDTGAADHSYNSIVPGDFSRQVLSVCTDRLAVLRLGKVGWSDLGTPKRVIATMAQAGITPPWRKLRAR
jgi:mannose-1-phosphate guanylyltransferase